MRRLLFALTPIVMILTLSVVNTSYGQTAAPDFTLTDIKGTHFTLSDFRGRIVLLDFFATWCDPCKAEIPHLQALWKTYQTDVLMIISIGVDTTHDTVSMLTDFAKENGMTWTVARDTSDVTRKYGVTAIPTLVLIDQTGNIKSQFMGLTEKETLQAKIEGRDTKTGMPITMIVTAIATIVTVVSVLTFLIIQRKKNNHVANS
jgi:peroxiredoxin